MVVMNTPTWDDVGADSLTKIIEGNWSPYSQTTKDKFSIKIVESIYNNEIFRLKHKHALRKIMLLEFSQYLENYLWPNFNSNIESKEYIMSVILMINEKFRQRVSSLKILVSSSESFSMFFDKFLHYLIEDKFNIIEKTQAIIFLNNAFNSLEIDFVRKCVQKLVSLTTWTSLIESRRELEFMRVPKLRKLYNALLKKEKKFLDDLPANAIAAKTIYDKSVFDRTFMWKLLQNFKTEFLDYMDSNITKFKSNPNNFPLNAQFYNYVRYGERFLELLVDLEAHLPNRRFFKVILDATHLITYCTLSPLNLTRPKDLSSEPKGANSLRNNQDEFSVFESYSPKYKEKAKLFGQLLEILKFYHDFEINDITGEALTEDEKTDLHYDKIAALQRICFLDFKDHPDLLKLALANVGRIDSRSELLKMLKLLDFDLLVKLASKLCLIQEPSEHDTPIPYTPTAKEFLIQLLISRHEKRPSQIQAINNLPLYPTEKVLWDQNLVPDDYYTGEDCLALPKLNLQFLTLHDYLLRNFRLFQLETMYEIRQDIQDALYRLKPWISENPDQIPVVYGGWARMAAPIDTLSIIDIGKPELGDESMHLKPSRVRADITVNLNIREDVREEWLTLRKHDVCFLISLKPTKPYGYKFKPPGIQAGPKGAFPAKRQRNEEQIMPEAAKEDEPDKFTEDEDDTVNDKKQQRNIALEEYLKQQSRFPVEYGIQHIRGCEIEGMLDVDGKVVEEGPRAKNHKLPTGVNRTWRIFLDTNQYALDIDIFTQQVDDFYLVTSQQIPSSNVDGKGATGPSGPGGSIRVNDANNENEEEDSGSAVQFYKKRNKEKASFSYDENTFHIILRRKPKENNFKAVLDTIRRIMNITQGRPGSLDETYSNQPLTAVPQSVSESAALTSESSAPPTLGNETEISDNKNHQLVSVAPPAAPGINVCEESVVPHWLHDLILGFGDPDSASYCKVFQIYRKKCPYMIGLDDEGFLDFRDTFLNRDHLLDSFPGTLIEFVKPADSTGVKDDNERTIFYKIKFPELTLSAPSTTATTSSGNDKVIYVKEYPVKTFGPPSAMLTLPRNQIKFTPTQVDALKAGLLPGLTLVVGPPGTGKTDLAVQIGKLLYHNRPTERILLITHSNQALNQIFAKLAPSMPGSSSTCDEAHLLRLGHGESELATDQDFGKYGRVNHVLRERIKLLHEVHQLRDTLYNIVRQEIPILNPYTLYNVDTETLKGIHSSDSGEKAAPSPDKNKSIVITDGAGEVPMEEVEMDDEATVDDTKALIEPGMPENDAIKNNVEIDQSGEAFDSVSNNNPDIKEHAKNETTDMDVSKIDSDPGSSSPPPTMNIHPSERMNVSSGPSSPTRATPASLDIDYEDPEEVVRILTSIIQGKGLPPNARKLAAVAAAERKLAGRYDFEEEHVVGVDPDEGKTKPDQKTGGAGDLDDQSPYDSVLTRDNIIIESYRHFKPAPFTASEAAPNTETAAAKNQPATVLPSKEQTLLSTSNYYRSPEISFTCETAVYFYRYEILSRWETFKNDLNKYKEKLTRDNSDNDNTSTTDASDKLINEKIISDFPFTKFMAKTLNEIVKNPKAYNFELLNDSHDLSSSKEDDIIDSGMNCETDETAPKSAAKKLLPHKFNLNNIFVNETDLSSTGAAAAPASSTSISLHEENWKIAENYFEYIKSIFDKLEEYRAFEVLMTGPERVNYLLIRSAHIIAMTCTHAALRRGDLVKLGFKYDSLIVEESAQILEIESFIPLLLQNTKDNVNRLKRVIMIGDHNQLPPVIKNMAFKNFANMEQSLFTRLVRLGVPTYTLDAQGRAKPSLCKLYSWRYGKLGNLPHTYTQLEFLRANPGFVFDFQLIDVPDFNGKGESTPTPHYFQNLGEAEYCVALFSYMRLVGYPANKITILTTYNGQKQLIRDIIEKRCALNPLLGKPDKITTVDKYQGQQNDYIILSLVRTKVTVGHLRDVRRLIVAVSRARLGLYVFCRVNLFSRCLELTPVFSQLSLYPLKLHLLPWELYPGTRLITGTDIDGNPLHPSKMPPPLVINDLTHISKFVYQMYNDKLKIARDLAMSAHLQSREIEVKAPAEILEIPEIEAESKLIATDPFARMAKEKELPIEYVLGEDNIQEEQIAVMPLEAEYIPQNFDTELLKEKIEMAEEPHYYKSSLEAEIGMDDSSTDED